MIKSSAQKASQCLPHQDLFEEIRDATHWKRTLNVRLFVVTLLRLLVSYGIETQQITGLTIQRETTSIQMVLALSILSKDR